MDICSRVGVELEGGQKRTASSTTFLRLTYQKNTKFKLLALNYEIWIGTCKKCDKRYFIFSKHSIFSMKLYLTHFFPLLKVFWDLLTSLILKKYFLALNYQIWRSTCKKCDWEIIYFLNKFIFLDRITFDPLFWDLLTSLILKEDLLALNYQIWRSTSTCKKSGRNILFQTIQFFNIQIC